MIKSIIHKRKDLIDADVRDVGVQVEDLQAKEEKETKRKNLLFLEKSIQTVSLPVSDKSKLAHQSSVNYLLPQKRPTENPTTEEFPRMVVIDKKIEDKMFVEEEEEEKIEDFELIDAGPDNDDEDDDDLH